MTAGTPTAIAVNSATGTVYVGTATSGGANGVSVFNGSHLQRLVDNGLQPASRPDDCRRHRWLLLRRDRRQRDVEHDLRNEH